MKEEFMAVQARGGIGGGYVQTPGLKPMRRAPARGKSGGRRPLPQKWLLAVDPFSNDSAESILKLTQAFGIASKFPIEAVYILSPASLNWSGDFNGNWVKNYKPIAEDKLAEFITNSEIQHTVVVCREPGLRASINTLLDFARKSKATCIVTTTHARTGLERMALGSFAETLILSSRIPVLVLNPSQRVPDTVRKILVPVDFSKDSRKLTDAAARYAKALGAGIVLYHKQTDPLDPVIQQGVYSLGGGWISVQKYIDEESLAKTKQLNRLEAYVQKQGVECAHILDASPGGLIESIDQVARESGADLISVLTRSGPWSAVLLGSVARSLVRNSSVPVLVQRF
jgi:nucleotide-binding universal stress UspA family protein